MSLRCSLTQAKNMLDFGGIGTSYGTLHSSFSSWSPFHIFVIGYPKTLLHPLPRIYRMQRYVHITRSVPPISSGPHAR